MGELCTAPRSLSLSHQLSLAKSSSEMPADPGEMLSAPQHHPWSLTSLGVGGTACVKRRLQASCDASCFNTSPPKPQNHHKNEKQFQKAVRNRPKSAADLEPPSPWLTPPGMHMSGRRAAALGQRKKLFCSPRPDSSGGEKKVTSHHPRLAQV